MGRYRYQMVSNNHQIRFGALTVDKGIITAKQLGKAVNVQMREDLSGVKHRLLGEILVDMGFMTKNQVDEMISEVINSLFL